MNQIALPNGGWMKFASFGGKVVERQDGVCPECNLFEKQANVVRPRCEHHFVERTAFGLKLAEAPRKYAELLDSYKKAVNVQRVAPLNPEFSFYRVMGVHGDWANTNGDLFRWGSKVDPSEPELLRLNKESGRHVYQSFVGKGNYKDHNNSKVADAVGILLDSVPNHTVKGIELLIAVDRSKDPMLVRGIDSGYITDVSMGCRVAYSICSICTNVAHNELEYCAHIKNWKGQMYSGPETGWKNVLAAEDNRGVEFIEESWVTVGADTKAKHLEKIAALRAAKGQSRLAEILVEAEAELNRNSLTDWNRVNDLMDMGIAQAILV